MPDRTAAAVQPLEEEKARLFAVVEDLQLGFVEGSLVVGYRLKCKHCCSGALKLRYQSCRIGSYMDDNTVKRAGTFLFNP